MILIYTSKLYTSKSIISYLLNSYRLNRVYNNTIKNQCQPTNIKSTLPPASLAPSLVKGRIYVVQSGIMINTPYTLITGGSCGIGLALANQFASHGHNLILVSRTKETLEETAKQLKKTYSVNIVTIAEDLSGTNSAINVFNECQKQKLEVEILVNNAGFGNYGFFASTNTETDLALIAVNITSLTHLTKLFLPGMIKNKSGRILNVGSMAAFFPGPFMDTYFASKTYVLSFSEGLHEEVRKLGVTVSCLCPGPTESNFGKRANYKFQAHNKIKMTAEKVAEITYKKMMKGKTLIIPGWRNNLLYHAVKIVPRGLRPRMVKYYSGFSDYKIECA